MSVNFDFESSGKFKIVRLHDSKLGDSCNLSELGSAISQMVPNDRPAAVLIDFSRVTFVNSSNLGNLITLESQLQTAGVKLALFGLQESVGDLFRITYTDRIISCHPDQASAEFAVAENM